MPLAHDLTETSFTTLLQARDFAQLFNRLGWDNIPRGTPPAVLLTVPGPPAASFTFGLVKEKHGFMVLHCAALPDAAQRRRLSLDMSKQYAEHLLIYAPGGAGAEQLWQLVVRDPGQPVRFFEFRVQTGKVPRDLWNRVEGLAISLADEEKGLTLTQVREKTRRAFSLNADKVTKKFYQEFNRQHQAFQGLIKGIESSTDRAWYTSIMLNRIMFIYFVQAQGYLLVNAAGPSGDDDKRYLKYKLDECAKLVGQDQFQSFYRDFLRVLFHEGLNAPLPHAPALAALLGRVPYLNGGLFEEHQLEQANPQLHIPDKAFEKLFAFLGQWDWILDSRQQATGTTINPDVLGYIFEQYINSLERKASGSYYTKEDITDYIAKNCLVPALFDRMAATVSHSDEVWNLLRDYPDSYLYPAQQKGMQHPLPPDVEAGRTDVAARSPLWNRPTPEPYGLPTELWRETIQRRDRAFAAQARLMSGQVQSIDELIMLNLDVRQLLHDAIRNAGSAEWVWACFEGLRSLSILDPTCGSGAFLFAALRLLEPLYEECLDRMLSFLPELENAKTLPVKRRVVEGMKKVRQELVEDHQENRAYFITKTIILHNLYGVDLMHEAVEIAKLRLFLQLMSTLPAPDYKDPNLGLEPLPDVDFNIRAGNTLVGFATRAELKKGLAYDLDGQAAEPAILEQADIVALAYAEFRHNQEGDDQTASKQAKAKLATELQKLNHRLNTLLHKQNTTVSYADFCQSYQPFHWFAEFYEIVTVKGGFDVIIGNPPYVTLDKIQYKIQGFSTTPCGDIYAPCMERSLNSLLKKEGVFGMIVPISGISTEGYESLRMVYNNSKRTIFSANFGVRPAKLFDGVDKRLSIVIALPAKNVTALFNTKYRRWASEERENLVQLIEYVPVKRNVFSIQGYPKISSKVELSIIQLLEIQKKKLEFYLANAGHAVLYTRKLQYFIQFLIDAPIIYGVGNVIQQPSELKHLILANKLDRDVVLALLNSNLFFWFYIAFSDCRNVNNREIKSFPINLDAMDIPLKRNLASLAKRLMDDFEKNAVFQKRNDKRAGLLSIQSFRPRESKEIIDEIDIALAQHYEFEPDQLDFILNYDIKYRMGAELDDED